MLWFILFLIPHRYRGLPRGHTTGTRAVVRACFKTFSGELQAHETELHITPSTGDIFAASLVMSHPQTTIGTDPNGRAATDALDVLKGDDLAGSQQIEVSVGAASVVTAVWAWNWAFPFLQALPAEKVLLVVHGWAHIAVDTQIRLGGSLHIRLAARTFFDFLHICIVGHGHLKVPCFLSG